MQVTMPVFDREDGSDGCGGSSSGAEDEGPWDWEGCSDGLKSRSGYGSWGEEPHCQESFEASFRCL